MPIRRVPWRTAHSSRWAWNALLRSASVGKVSRWAATCGQRAELAAGRCGWAATGSHSPCYPHHPSWTDSARAGAVRQLGWAGRPGVQLSLQCQASMSQSTPPHTHLLLGSGCQLREAGFVGDVLRSQGTPRKSSSRLGCHGDPPPPRVFYPQLLARSSVAPLFVSRWKAKLPTGRLPGLHCPGAVSWSGTWGHEGMGEQHSREIWTDLPVPIQGTGSKSWILSGTFYMWPTGTERRWDSSRSCASMPGRSRWPCGEWPCSFPEGKPQWGLCAKP